MAKKQTITAQATAAGIAPSVVYQRLHKGWTLQRALNTPVQKRKKKVEIEQGDRLPSDDTPIYPPDYRIVVERLEKAQAELIFGAKRCKLVALTCSVLIALLVAVIISG